MMLIEKKKIILIKHGVTFTYKDKKCLHYAPEEIKVSQLLMHNASRARTLSVSWHKQNQSNKIQLNKGSYQHCVVPLKLLFLESNLENVGKSEIHVSVDNLSHKSTLKPWRWIKNNGNSFNDLMLSILILILSLGWQLRAVKT